MMSDDRAGAKAAFLDLLADDVIYDINQGGRETGKAAFGDFFDRMARSHRERIEELLVLVSPDGGRAAAEFVVHGIYLRADENPPAIHEQNYVPQAGAFLLSQPARLPAS